MLDGPFRGSTAISAGGVTRGELRGPRFRRVFPDIYLPADLEVDLAVRSYAAFLLIGGRGALGGYSAAELLGADCAPRHAAAEIVVDRDVRRRSGLIVHRDALPKEEVCSVDEVQVTTPARTAYDLGRRLDLVEAVAAVDALAGWAGFRPAELLELRTRHPGARGCRQLDRVVDLAEPAADSPMETRLRLALLQRGLPRPAVGYRVVDERWRVVAVLDLAYPEARLGIEYDGDGHLDRSRRAHDQARDGRLIELGWLILRFSHVDVLRRADRTADRVRRVLETRSGAEFGSMAV